jgi:lipoprotein-anchoring transpeptidase ErfK/SrfK
VVAVSGERWIWLLLAGLVVSGCGAMASAIGTERVDRPPVEAVTSRLTGVTPDAPTTSEPSASPPAAVTTPPEPDDPVDRPADTRPPATRPPDHGSSSSDPACVAVLAPGETLADVAARFDEAEIDVTSLEVENGLAGATVAAGDRLDVCVGNGIDDLTGEQRADDAEAEAARAVQAQQRRLNELFAGSGIAELQVDGISGPVTRQRLCAARLALGLPVSTADMAPGSEEERVLMATEALPIPFTSAVLSERWILIDRTCQIMFVGSGTDRVEFVFPTSTGLAGFETRTQDRTPAYRYNPADHNGGWHNSTTYPVSDDNPLNGNMYRPLYFDRGQAIHGANNVPRSPASHGCARLRVSDQDTLLAWLGLAGSRATTDVGRIDVTVNVQGTWRG